MPQKYLKSLLFFKLKQLANTIISIYLFISNTLYTFNHADTQKYLTGIRAGTKQNNR